MITLNSPSRNDEILKEVFNERFLPRLLNSVRGGTRTRLHFIMEEIIQPMLLKDQNDKPCTPEIELPEISKENRAVLGNHGKSE